MNSIASKDMKSGGKTFRTLMDKWRAEEESYRLKVYFSEMDVNHYISDNNRLRSLKQKYRENFTTKRRNEKASRGALKLPPNVGRQNLKV